MDDSALRAHKALDGPFDKMLTGRGQNLNGHVIRDQATVDNLPDKIKIRVRRTRETDLDFLEAHLYQRLEQPVLARAVHRINQRLITIPQINAAPDRSLIDDLRGPCPVWQIDTGIGAVFFNRHAVHHFISHGRRAFLSAPARCLYKGLYANYVPERARLTSRALKKVVGEKSLFD